MCLVLCHVVDAVRDDLPMAGTREIVIVDNRWFDCIGHAFPMKIAQHFVLFRIDADHGMSSGDVLLFQLCNVFKLSVAISMLTHRSLNADLILGLFHSPKR